MAELYCTITSVLRTAAPTQFATFPAADLALDLQGIPGDRHYGFTRKAGAREPWLPRGANIRSGRQISLVAEEELAEIAAGMALPRLEPGWLGANAVVRGIAAFSRLPWGTRLFCSGGAVLVNEGENAPCRRAGAEIARAYPDRSGLDTLFVKAAKHRRGIVATVELAGTLAAGPARLRLPPGASFGGTLL